MIAFFLNDHGAATTGSTTVIREELLGAADSGSGVIWLRRRLSWAQKFRTPWNGAFCYTIGFPRTWPLGRWFSYLQMAHIFRKHRVRLAHIHWSGVDHWGFASYRGARPRFPYILTFHAFNERRLRRMGLLEPGKLKSLMASASKISAVSRSLKAELASFYPAVADKIQIIANGVRVESTGRPLPDGVPERFILSAGLLSHAKGSDLLLLAFFDLWREGKLRVPLVLCGQDEPKGQVQRLVDALRLKDVVIVLPDCPHEVVLSLMERCLFFVSATREESFGIAILEAMSCGKAVAAPRVGGIPEYLAHESNGLMFEPGDVESFKKAVMRLAGDDALRRRLGREGALTASCFQWGEARASYGDMHKEILGARR